MVIFTARLKALPGKELEAVEALKKMVTAVESETDTRAYQFHKITNAPGEFLFYEVYADQAACDAHMKTPHFEILKSLFGDLLDGDFGVQVEDLELVSGFVRI